MTKRRLRSRVLLLTTLFALALFAIAFGLSWHAKLAEERWSRLVGVETRAIAALEELVRAQNAFNAQRRAPAQYRLVAQLLQDPSLRAIDISNVRTRVDGYRATLEDPTATADEIDLESVRVVAAAESVIGDRKREISRQLPALERGADEMMYAGLAIAWIIVLSSFAAVQLTLRKVVRPIEDLAASADRIAAGDLAARAPVGGDLEVAKLGTAFNRMADELKVRARTDDLTSLPNFRAFRERIDAEIERASRYEEQFGVLVLDLDRFKQYNDRFGHLAGNDALQRVSRAIRESLRVVDFPARYGGEEFAVIVPQVDAASAAAIAERVRAAVEALPEPRVTVSIGGAIYPVDGATPEELFHTADTRLYQAKKNGRNQVVATDDPGVILSREDGEGSPSDVRDSRSSQGIPRRLRGSE